MIDHTKKLVQDQFTSLNGYKYDAEDLLKQDPEALLEDRYQKFRKIGAIDESGAVDPHIKRNMKKRDALHFMKMMSSGYYPLATEAHPSFSLQRGKALETRLIFPLCESKSS